MFNIEIFILIFCLSFDVLIASLAYSADKIKIPLKSTISINLIVTITFTLSLFFGNIIGQLLNENIVKFVSFSILLILSFCKFFEYSLKKIFSNIKSEKHFKIFNFNLILQVINNNTLADTDHSKELSIKESITLALALSIDGICAAFASGMIFNNYLLVIISSFTITFIMFFLGKILGSYLSRKKDINLGWLCGLILLVLAITKLI